MAKILKPYEIPVVSGDLTFPETLNDVFFALENLSSTMDDSFAKISKRIEDERHRVSNINERLNACQTKVKSIEGSNRATTVFSTAKFPGPKTLPVFTCLFNQLSQQSDPYREPEDDVIYALPRGSKSSVGNRELTQEILTIYCRLNGFNSEMKKTEFIMEDKGLGPLPSVLPTVGSLLLYNSNVNPYKNYQYLDNLEAAGRMRETMGDDGKNNIAMAPSTLLNGDMLSDVDNVDLNFRPDMGDINAFALPDNLPLDFVAVDVSFQGVVLPNIAPSAQYNAKAANFNLPQLTDGGVPMTAGAPPPAPAPDAAAASAPPPPPPPPPTAAPVAAAAAPPPPPPPAAPVAAPEVAAAAPPPPPPGPSPASAASAASAAAPSAADDDDDSGGGGGSSFLDAIKGMNVNKLRKKEESTVAAAKVQKKEEQKKPLSVGEELRLKLQRRNNAMTGVSGKEQQKKDAALVEAAKASSTSSASAVSASATATPEGTSKPLPTLPSAGPGGGSTLKAVGFKAAKKDDAFDSDSSDDENSVGSFEGDNVGRGASAAGASSSSSSGGKALPSLPPLPGRNNSPPPASMPPPIAMPGSDGAQRRGSSLLDTTAGSTVSNLLSAAKARNDNDDDGDDDEWDS